jgi:hypothetical protein
MPRLGSLLQARMSRPHRVPAPLSRPRVQELHDAQTDAGKLGSAAGTGAAVGRGCVFMARTENHRRSQAPLFERFGPVSRPAAVEVSPRGVRERARRAIALADELLDCARRRGLALPVDPAAVYTRLLRNARLLGYWEHLLAQERPEVVVTSVATAPSARAMLLAARAAGIPSVFISHTAVVSVDLLNTLPVDRAGLRGVEEVRHLGALGADPDRLDVVGNPTISPQPVPRIDPRARPVFAAGLEDESRLGPLVDVIHRALGERVAVGRHPSAGQTQPGEFPGGWSVASGRTYDLLAAGPPALVQHSSGVALEALHLGIPVVELRYPGKASLYPFLRAPYVRFATDSRELACAIQAAGEDAANAERRQEWIAWARGWSWPTGREAEERVVALVEQAMAEGPRGAIWEPWATPAGTPSRPPAAAG